MFASHALQRGYKPEGMGALRMRGGNAYAWTLVCCSASTYGQGEWNMSVHSLQKHICIYIYTSVYIYSKCMRILKFQVLYGFVVHWHICWCLSGLSQPPAGPVGAPREPSGAHLTMFNKYVKNCKIWKVTFWTYVEPYSPTYLMFHVFLQWFLTCIVETIWKGNDYVSSMFVSKCNINR